MSSSVGVSSALHLTLLNQLLQRVGVNDQDSVDDKSTVDTGSTSQTDGDSSSFNAQADALFNSLDSDGDGKLSKSEFRTGFQKLSQDMRSVLINQQNISAENTVSTAGASSSGATSPGPASSDDTVSQAEFGTGQSAAKLLDSLLHSAGDTASASTDLSQASSAPGIANKTAPGGISTEEMDKLLANLKDSDPGDVANAPAMIRLQQSTNLHAALTDLLQATHEPQGNGGASTTGTPS